MNLIRRVWRGEVRLWLTYWVWGVGGNVAFVAALVPLLLAAAFGRLSGTWAWLAYLTSLGWFVFVFGAIWRSAERYPGPRLWAALARLGVALGIVRMTAEAAVLVALTRAG